MRADRLRLHQQATTIERIWNHVMAPHDFPLTEEEHDYYGRLKQVYSIIREHAERHEQVILIEEIEGVVESTSYRLIRDCEALFGRLAQRGLELDKIIHCERLLEVAKAALAEGDRITWRFLMSDYAEIRGFKKDVNGLQPGDVTLPVTVWSDDEALLKQAEDGTE